MDYINKIDHKQLAADDDFICRNVVSVAEFLDWFIECGHSDYQRRLQEVLQRRDRGYDQYRRQRFNQNLSSLSLCQYNWWEDEYKTLHSLDEWKRNYFILIVKQWVASKESE